MKPSDLLTIGFFTAAVPLLIYGSLASNRLPYEGGFGWVDVVFIIGGIVFWRIVRVVFDGRYKLTKTGSIGGTAHYK